jgi:hypothetical protein
LPRERIDQPGWNGWAELAVTKPPVRGLREGSAQWLRPKLRVKVKHLKTKGVLRHATVKQLITD